MGALAETWVICSGKTLALFDALSDEQFGTSLKNGKDVAGQFSHLYSVRKAWLKQAKYDGVALPRSGVSREQIRGALVDSGEALALAISAAEESGKKCCGFPGGTGAFVGYLCAHEGFHWAQVELALRQAEVPLDEKVGYGLWEWKG